MPAPPAEQAPLKLCPDCPHPLAEHSEEGCLHQDRTVGGWSLCMCERDPERIDKPTALRYLAALLQYANAEAEGEPLPDDALSMLADVEEWAEAQP